MQPSYKSLCTLTITAILFFLISPLSAQTVQQISAEAFREDIAVLEEALTTLHPGLYRYKTKAEVQQALQKLAGQQKPLSVEAAYLKLTEFSASLMCSHTHTNPWNQNQNIKELTSEKADKLPFSWRFLEDNQGKIQFFVDLNSGDESELAKGTEVVAINGIAIDPLINRLYQYVSADGINPVKVKYQLMWQQGHKYQWFDILLPLIAPPKMTTQNQFQYQLTVRMSKELVDLQVSAISAQDREQRLADKYQFKAKTDKEKWKAEIFESDTDNQTTAYLKMETFAIWQMSMDWKAYLKEQFQRFANAHADKLIVDLRGNEGGMYEVAEYLYPFLIKEPVTVSNFRQKVMYKTVPEELRPYLKTWNPAIYDISAMVGAKSGNFWQLDSPGEQTYQPNGKNSFEKVIVLTDGANSSATFIMSRSLKQSGQVILVGETLGGNTKGQNGGQMFFLKLPNSQISIDVPLIHFYDDEAQTSVLQPDVLITNSYEDWMNDHDRILQTAIDM